MVAVEFQHSIIIVNNSVKIAMWTVQQKVSCVLWLAETKSVKLVQHRFRREYNLQRHDPVPDYKRIMAWDAKLKQTGSLLSNSGKHAKKRVSEENIELIRNCFTRSPRKSIRKASLQLQIPRSTVHNVVHKRLRLRAYKIQITQKIKHDDKHKRLTFAASVLDKIDENNSYLDHICFSDESTFHISGKVNRHNCRIWGSENPSVVFQHERDSPKVNVWCGLMKDRVIGPFFFAEPTVTARTYLDMLELYVVPQLPAGTIYQQDGAPPHYALEVRKFLNDNFPGQWIGRGSETIAWPPRSPDLTPLDFFLWGFVKDQVYSTPVADLDDLKLRINLALQNVTINMLRNSWREVDNRLDICRATNGSHVEIY